MSKRLVIALTGLVKNVTMGKMAISHGMSAPSMTRVINGTTSPDTIDNAAHEAFVLENPILDVLLLDATEAGAEISGNKSGALAAARQFENALRAPGLNDRDRWINHRFAAKLLLSAGQRYRPEEIDPVFRLEVEPLLLQKARVHYRALTDLKCVAPEFQDLVALGVRLNFLAIDMVIQAADGPVPRTSAVLTGYEALMIDLRKAYAARHVQSVVRLIDTAPGVFGKREQVLRQLLLYCGSAIGELSLEGGNPTRTLSVIDELVDVFGRAKRGLIEAVFFEMCWDHLQADYRALFGQCQNKAG